MKELIVFGLAFSVLSGCANMPESAVSKTAVFKRVPLDQFYAGKISTMPLSIELPSEYDYADQLKVPVTYAYWMRRQDMGRAAQGSLPSGNGYIYGKVSLDVGYDAATESFGEENIEAQLKQAGIEILNKKRYEVAGYPALNMEIRAPNGSLVCAMYVATLVSSNTLYIGYRPAGNDRAQCARFHGSLQSNKSQ